MHRATTQPAHAAQGRIYAPAAPLEGKEACVNDFFHKFAHTISNAVGSPVAFIAAVAIVAVWGITGPLFHFSDTWQLVINTGTTIITFLMVFVIQNTQNRDAKAIHLKLDELIRAMEGARTKLVDLEDLSDEELAGLEKQFQHMHERLNPADAKGDGGGVEAGDATADMVRAGRDEAPWDDAERPHQRETTRESAAPRR